jgi:hypothetical protein
MNHEEKCLQCKDSINGLEAVYSVSLKIPSIQTVERHYTKNEKHTLNETFDLKNVGYLYLCYKAVKR